MKNKVQSFISMDLKESNTLYVIVELVGDGKVRYEFHTLDISKCVDICEDLAKGNPGHRYSYIEVDAEVSQYCVVNPVKWEIL